METSVMLSTIAGLGYTVAYLDYNRGVLKGPTTPSSATWGIWAAMSLVSTGSYFSATGDFWKSIIPVLNIALCIGTFLLVLNVDKRKRIDLQDVIPLTLGLLAVGVWYVFQSAAYANLIVQFSIFVGFIPTWLLIWQNPSAEHPRPWWTWALAYCVATIVVVLRWRHQWIDIVYPLNCLSLHASVPIIASMRAKASATTWKLSVA